MKKKFVLIIGVLTLIGILAATSSWFSPDFYRTSPQLTIRLAEVSEFTINESMTIVRKDGIWCSRDDDFYPVNNDVVDMFLADLRSSAEHTQRYKGDLDGKDTIVLRGGEGPDIQLFFDAVDGQAEEIKALVGKNAYVLRGNFRMPSQPYQWFNQPLIPLSNSSIEEIYGADPDSFAFSELFFYQVTKQNDFAEWDSHEVKIVTVDGIVINMTIYAQARSYWASVDLQTSVMPTIEASDYVKTNGFLYDGWFFELPQPEGNRLFGFENNDQ